jgi:hypothetical protein
MEAEKRKKEEERKFRIQMEAKKEAASMVTDDLKVATSSSLEKLKLLRQSLQPLQTSYANLHSPPSSQQSPPSHQYRHGSSIAALHDTDAEFQLSHQSQRQQQHVYNHNDNSYSTRRPNRSNSQVYSPNNSIDNNYRPRQTSKSPPTTSRTSFSNHEDEEEQQQQQQQRQQPTNSASLPSTRATSSVPNAIKNRQPQTSNQEIEDLFHQSNSRNQEKIFSRDQLNHNDVISQQSTPMTVPSSQLPLQRSPSTTIIPTSVVQPLPQRHHVIPPVLDSIEESEEEVDTNDVDDEDEEVNDEEQEEEEENDDDEEGEKDDVDEEEEEEEEPKEEEANHEQEQVPTTLSSSKKLPEAKNNKDSSKLVNDQSHRRQEALSAQKLMQLPKSSKSPVQLNNDSDIEVDMSGDWNPSSQDDENIHTNRLFNTNANQPNNSDLTALQDRYGNLRKEAVVLAQSQSKQQRQQQHILTITGTNQYSMQSEYNVKNKNPDLRTVKPVIYSSNNDLLTESIDLSNLSLQVKSLTFLLIKLLVFYNDILIISLFIENSRVDI